MEKKNIEFPQYAEKMLEILKSGRVLLVAQGHEEKPNPMTIAWGSIMFAWNKPIFVAMVRDSRHTYRLLEEGNNFTVNFFDKGYSKAMGFCGSKSGREFDKFKETNLTPIKSKSVDSPIVEEAFLHIECKVVYKQAMNSAALDPSIREAYYDENVAEKTYHTLYYGEILEMYGDISK
ncbi:flavin reductase family protein [Geosporobacter ferrireducens]|nr:flavin reductase family protein [Geosporobacter ferrireducens]